MTLSSRINSFPPILVRLLARYKGGAPLSIDEISDGAGRLTAWDVHLLAQKTSWDEIPIRHALLFTRGCRLDWDDAKAWRRVDDYLRKNPNLEYLRKSTEWEHYYKPLLIRWRTSYTTVPDHIHKPVRDLLIRLTPILNVN